MAEFDDWVAEQTYCDGDCLIWTGATNGKGYARASFQGRLLYVHREVYRRAGKRLKKGKVLDHLCRRRACVRLEHLEQVTSQVNSQRGIQGARTECLNGHLYTEQSTGYHNPTKRNGQRYCRTCKNERRRKAA